MKAEPSPLVVSLLAHDNPDTLPETARNHLIATGSEALVVHWSRGARSSLPRDLGDSRIMVNPRRIDTGWGRILQAHVTNADYLAKLGFPDSTRVVMHASNDLYLRSALGALADGGCAYQIRPVNSDSCCPWLSRPHNLAGLAQLRRLFPGGLYWSQVEGSVYELGTLRAAPGVMNRLTPALSGRLPLEEFVLPSMQALAAPPSRPPLIFSEVLRAQANAARRWSMHPFRRVQPLRPALRLLVRRTALEDLTRRGIWGICHSDIRALDAGMDPVDLPTVVREGRNSWAAYRAGDIYGVKRVPRAAGSDLRKFILGLARLEPPGKPHGPGQRRLQRATDTHGGQYD